MSVIGNILVDLDGTLAQYGVWKGISHIGEPIIPMVTRVRRWLVAGRSVVIFTARVGPQKDVNDIIRAREAIAKWCLEQFGQELPVTATKDFSTTEIWDDRAIGVERNTGRRLDGRQD